MRLIGRQEGFEVRLPATAKPGDSPGLEEIARSSGLRLREVALREGRWRQDFGALLGFDKESGQPRALLSGSRGRPRLIDPTTGDELAFDAARARLAPTAFELTAHLPFRAMTFRDLLGFALARGWRDAVPILLTGAILGLLGLATPIGTAYMIDTVIPGHEVGFLVEIGLVLAVLGGMAFIMEYVGTLAFSRAESRTGRALQSGMMDRMLRLPMSFFQGYSAGDLATRVMAITQIQTLASTASVNAILSGIFSFALMFYYDTRLALWAALLISVYCVLSMLLGYLRLRQERPLAELTGKLNNSLLQLILGVTKIRLAAGEDRAFARWASLFAQGRRHQLAAERIGAWQAALNQTLTLAGLLLFVLLIGKPSANGNLIAIGAFAALLVAFQNFAGSLTRMLQVATDLAGHDAVSAALPSNGSGAAGWRCLGGRRDPAPAPVRGRRPESASGQCRRIQPSAGAPSRHRGRAQSCLQGLDVGDGGTRPGLYRPSSRRQPTGRGLTPDRPGGG
ncbi:ABC transporter transmembrane domain-containing protein, partial [uncultured Thiodictyon sp.]|uniref:ABC transporter transmembrane domain-containing protein n=1 Tax=uncultured Thiodictyon sp. TaxID=1846217 RepID=UPI0025EBB6B2